MAPVAHRRCDSFTLTFIHSDPCGRPDASVGALSLVLPDVDMFFLYTGSENAVTRVRKLLDKRMG